jgi:hypothetical protein
MVLPTILPMVAWLAVGFEFAMKAPLLIGVRA